MNDDLNAELEENRFEKILDDANRSLERVVDCRFLDNLPNVAKSDEAYIPFPYGPQPDQRTGWK